MMDRTITITDEQVGELRQYWASVQLWAGLDAAYYEATVAVLRILGLFDLVEDEKANATR